MNEVLNKPVYYKTMKKTLTPQLDMTPLLLVVVAAVVGGVQVRVGI